MAGPVFSYLRNPHSHFPVLRTPQAHQHFGAQGVNFGPKSLFQFYGPPTYDRFRQHYSCSLYQQTGWDVDKQGGTHSHTQIFGTWGTSTLDMLATVHNMHLPQFMSPIPETRALALDALSQDWQGRSMFIFQPFPCLAKSFRNSGPPRRAK